MIIITTIINIVGASFIFREVASFGKFVVTGTPQANTFIISAIFTLLGIFGLAIVENHREKSIN